mmetsp:Transcript_99856/g.286860  ORF Transcript_99856/g.286860 Transcript_99856/m.286860 type:complete len:208 (+) Transcript_99856:77-700(+)
MGTPESWRGSPLRCRRPRCCRRARPLPRRCSTSPCSRSRRCSTCAPPRPTGPGTSYARSPRLWRTASTRRACCSASSSTTKFGAGACSTPSSWCTTRPLHSGRSGSWASCGASSTAGTTAPSGPPHRQRRGRGCCSACPGRPARCCCSATLTFSISSGCAARRATVGTLARSSTSWGLSPVAPPSTRGSFWPGGLCSCKRRCCGAWG